MPETCGQPTSTGDPCQNPAGPDGTCHLDAHEPDDATGTCGQPTADGTPCQLPATNPDGTCHIPAHGGDATNHGRPYASTTKLTEDLIQDLATDLEDPRNMVRGVLAEHGIPRSTWNRWLREGRRDLGVGLKDLMSGQHVHADLGDATNIYGVFLQRLARAYDLAMHRLNRMWVDGLIKRTELKEIRNDAGELEDLQAVPYRLDPITGEKKLGETPNVRAIRDYARARFSDVFSEKVGLEHAGQVTVEEEQRLMLSTSDFEDEATLEALETLIEASGPSEDGGSS